MKKDIHPQYHTQATVKCACGNKFLIGSTRENTEIEICGKCHPFYTGEERANARGGRVERFKARMEKHTEMQKRTKPTKKPRIKKERKTQKKSKK